MENYLEENKEVDYDALYTSRKALREHREEIREELLTQGHSTRRFTKESTKKATTFYQTLRKKFLNELKRYEVTSEFSSKERVFTFNIVEKKEVNLDYVLDSLKVYGNSIISGLLVEQVGLQEIKDILKEKTGQELYYSYTKHNEYSGVIVSCYKSAKKG